MRGHHQNFGLFSFLVYQINQTYIIISIDIYICVCVFLYNLNSFNWALQKIQ